MLRRLHSCLRFCFVKGRLFHFERQRPFCNCCYLVSVQCACHFRRIEVKSDLYAVDLSGKQWGNAGSCGFIFCRNDFHGGKILRS